MHPQVGAILRAAAGSFQATASATAQYAALIESGGSISSSDIAQITMSFAPGPMMLPPLNTNVDSKKKKGKGMSDIIFQSGLSPQTGEAEGDGKKRKRGAAKEKKAKDPNAPKRPPSAYLLYQNEFRKLVKDQHPEMSYPQVLQEISKMWANLSPVEKKPYLDATDLAKVEFEKAKTEYLEAHPTAAAVAATAGGGGGLDQTDDTSENSAESPVLPKSTSSVGLLVDQLAKDEEKRKRKAAKAKATAAVKAVAPPPPPPPAPVAASESLSDDDIDEETDEEEEEEEEEKEVEPPKKKSKKVKTPPPSPGKGKKDKKRK